ncbi:glycosyltransferase family 2 protein [Hymenobacter latericus]|uniref:glycosyltransferase family 2 protein n=1 Tax=Hymenobacter sp. YIM 151858-1 TaxID=2987688 RepID=UPI002227F89D|nr:glycosyltransferase family 2 protein [Hymenobacter sp. YIM 151858-1]UYZ60562.1 glycosyltransferase family 2 protein [Hymenobacter sp. YIM 151858-1]
MAYNTPADGDYNASDVAVVILNWNGQRWLEQFLPSVLAHSDNARVVVADNASSDNSVAWLAAHYPQVQVLQHAENLGFCQGYNQALGQLPGYNYYVLLNSDVEVTAGWLRPLRELLESNLKAAAVQPKIRAYNARTEFEYAGAAGGYLDRLGYPFCRGRLFDALETDLGQYDDPRRVAWATGACMMVRAAAWHSLQGLEPEFFAHMEEIDLCWRLWNAGHEVWYHGGSTVYHVGGGTLHKSNPRKTYLNFRNGLALLYKNLAPGELWPTLLTRFALDYVAAAQMLTKGNPADAAAIVRAHRHFFGKLSYWRERRRLARPQLPAAQRPGTYLGSLVWAYFGQGKRRFSELKFN